MTARVPQRDIEQWKKLAIEELSELECEVGTRSDGISGKRVAIVVGESFGKMFNRRIEINRQTAMLSAIECAVYQIAKEFRLTCDPLDREDPPHSWKGGKKVWADYQLKLPKFSHMKVPCLEPHLEEILETLSKGGGKYEVRRFNNGKTAVRRVGVQKRADHETAKPGTRLYQSGPGGKTIRR